MPLLSKMPGAFVLVPVPTGTRSSGLELKRRPSQSPSEILEGGTNSAQVGDAENRRAPDA